MAEQSGAKILRLPNRQERRANFKKYGVAPTKAELAGELVETHELSDLPGYPDFKPAHEDDYFERLKDQKLKQFDFIKAKHLQKVKNGQSILARLDKAKENPIPRYLRRALFSGDEERVEACIDKALAEGFTQEDIEDQVNLLAAQIAAGEVE